MIHGGAAALGDGGVLVVGPSGAGKSTTVLAILAAGGRSAGDDYVLVGGNPLPVAYSVYGAMRLVEDHRSRFPFLMPRPDLVTPSRDGAAKLTSYVSVHNPAAMVSRLPITAIVMPRPRPGGRTRARREGGARALFALAPNTLRQLNPQDRAAFSRMASLCRALPCWSLDLGDDLGSLPGVVEAIVAQSGQA